MYVYTTPRYRWGYQYIVKNSPGGIGGAVGLGLSPDTRPTCPCSSGIVYYMCPLPPSIQVGLSVLRQNSPRRRWGKYSVEGPYVFMYYMCIYVYIIPPPFDLGGPTGATGTA